ncbi:MAG TPA: TetR/AcrR family transcriptional regulator [Dongiaceae bacterium]|jgi:TetR/AcrR family transcriptional regulator, mexJK operon transcriptional repressor|nr:TetR/AcrR family transcriptional regulator [Dongiaceae bacterium]
MPDTAASLEPVSSQKALEILRAARKVFIAKGFEAASMDAVARTAGVSKATVYAHFRSKSDLFAAIVAQVAGRLTGEIHSVMEARLPLRQALMRIGTEFLEVLVDPERVRIFRMMVAETDRFPELGRVFYRAGPLVMQDCLASFLAEAAAEGKLVIEDSGLAARQLLSLIKSDLHLRCLFDSGTRPSSAECERQVEAAVETFLKAYGARPV